MVSVSPLMPNLDSDDEPISTDPRFISAAFRSFSIDSAGYSDHDPQEDDPAFAGTPDPGANRRRRRKRQSDVAFDGAIPFRYPTVADGNAFRLVNLQPGTGTSPIECSLEWNDTSAPNRDYYCLSYAWQSSIRDAAIFCDGFEFRVTRNLLRALQHLRPPTKPLKIWIDQICINQEDIEERGHQVSIMKKIFTLARETYVWLGEAGDRSGKLCEYARKLRRGDANPRSTLNRILSPRELKDAIHGLLLRPWFQRVWVIPEVALSKYTTVAIGSEQIAWDALVRLVREVPVPFSEQFDKQRCLLGNSRQRLAIITQMLNSQKHDMAHTDITQLLIIAKSSQATDIRDMVYAFYGLTLLTTFPNYSMPPAHLYTEIADMYIRNLLWVDSYATQHDLTEDQKGFQLMSILFSAGALHQHHILPSWVPDWTYGWHLAPVWCMTAPNFGTGLGKDEWTIGIRGDYRAGGSKLETFEPLQGRNQLRLSAFIFDTILLVNEGTPASTPDSSQILGTSPADSHHELDSPTLRYGRHFITTARGRLGLTTPGIVAGDELAILLGGDAPVVLRPYPEHDRKNKAYKLMCECYLQSHEVMHGDLLRQNWTLSEDIVLI